MAEYIEEVALEGCGRTVPRARLASIAMLESVADVTIEETHLFIANCHFHSELAGGAAQRRHTYDQKGSDVATCGGIGD